MTVVVSTKHLKKLQKAIQALMDKDIPAALEILHGVLEKDPEVPEALHLLGMCSAILGDLGQALELITNAHALDGECRDYVDALASLKTKSGNLTESLYYAKLATTLSPHPELSNLTPNNLQDYAGALANVDTASYILNAMLMFSQRRFDDAVANCEKELKLNPQSVEALIILGKSLMNLGEHHRAEIALQAAEQISPGVPDTIALLAQSLVLQSKFDDAIACFEYAQMADKDEIIATTAHIQALSFMDDVHWQTRRHVEDECLTRAKAMGVETEASSETAPGGKIRIGLLSNALFNCDEALVLESFLKNYNRNRYEVFCFQQSITHDTVTERLKGLCDSWRPIFDLDDWVLASIIAADGIQVMIDTIGYGPNNRRATLAAKPSPLQVAWLNHLDGTGKDIVDLILSDTATLDTDSRTALEGQDVAELETGLFAFPEFGLMGDAGPLPAIKNDTISFGAHADLARINARTARTWCQLLRAVPNSLLVLNVSPNLPQDIHAKLSARFALFGLSKRVVFLTDAPESKSPELEFLAGIDVLLDPAVNANAAQVARALWMGVPVLTHDTMRRSGLIAASVLMAAGKGDWVAKSSDELIEKAHALTSDLQALADIRATLRDDIKDTALFQGRDFAREIEDAINIALEDKNTI